MLNYYKINKNKISLSLMGEILDIEEVGLTINSNTIDIFAYLDELQIPYKRKTIEEVLRFLFDRLLYEYMRNQSYYNQESYSKFKNTFIYDQIHILIYHVKSLLLWISNNDLNQIPKKCRSLYRKTDIHPIDETNYLEKYEHYKLYMEFLPPEKLPRYFNQLVGLKHFSIRTKAIYHALVEELEIRDVNYDCMLYGKERMFSYSIEIVTINNKLTVLKK